MCLGLALAGSPAWAQTEQHDHGAPKDPIKAGTVNFETSCNPAVKDDFNLAVAELHSFWFPEARAIFEGVLKKDPNCAIAYWGIALTLLGQPVRRISARRRPLPAARPRSTRARPPARRRAREKGYIDAVAGLFSSADVTTQRARVVAYEGATELVASQNLRRRRGADLLGAGDRANRAAHRQDLRAEPEGRGNPGAALQEDAESSRAGALHHSLLRRAGAGRQGAARGARVCRHRAVGAARAPHAVAHLHPRRRMEGIGRHQHQFRGRSGEDRRRRRSACTRWTTRPTPICRWAWTRKPRACSITR